MADQIDITDIGPKDAAEPKLILRLIAVVGIALSLFQLYAAGVQPLGLFYQRPIHLGFILVLCFLVYPPRGRAKGRSPLDYAIDGFLILASIAVGAWVPVNIDTIANQIFPRDIDVAMGVLTVLLVLEAARRAVGWVMTVIAGVFLLYAFAGSRGELPFLADFMPGILNHRGYSLDRLASQMTLGAEGIYGIPLGVAATFIFVFVLFGAFLEVTGAGKFFIDLAYATTGRQRGGPAKAAVVASAGMGSISGSAIANVVTTGAFTIPLMKKLGYRPAQAGGVEAAASTGGQIMPPLMGAGAFLMSEFTQLPYVTHRVGVDFPGLSLFWGRLPACAYRGCQTGDARLDCGRTPQRAPSDARRVAFHLSACGAHLFIGGRIFTDAGGVLCDCGGDGGGCGTRALDIFKGRAQCRRLCGPVQTWRGLNP